MQCFFVTAEDARASTTIVVVIEEGMAHSHLSGLHFQHNILPATPRDARRFASQAALSFPQKWPSLRKLRA